MKIGVFDSGVGGLTVLKELTKNFKGEYVYVADLKNCPYGEKSEKYLEDALIEMLDYFISINVDLIVIACGTMSSIARKMKISSYKGIKVLNVIEAVKYHLENKEVDNILLMATLSTIKQENFKKSLLPITKNIIDCPCPDFVPLIESGNLEKDQKLEVVSKYINSKIKDKLNDNSIIILGCTHYPILKDEIREVSKIENIVLPGEAMVEYIKDNFDIKGNKNGLTFNTNKESKILNKFVKYYFNDNKVTNI